MAKKIQKLSKKIGTVSFYGILLADYTKGVQSETFGSLKALFGAGLPGTETFGDLVTTVVQILLIVAGSVAAIFLIVGAYRYITASGKEEQMEGAKKTMTGAIIGLIIIALAFAVISIIANLLIGGTTGTGITPQ